MEKSGFQKNFENFLTYNFFGPASEHVLLRGAQPSEITIQGGSLESKIVYRGVGADFEKRKNISG